uniref:Microfibril associated protein 2 n=1 Tax=Bubo bubo TaxID=30461 RepID=A0A8C0EKN5_BUBBB
MSGWGGGGFLGDACTVPLLTDVTPRAPEEQFRYQSQQQSQQEIVPAPTPGGNQLPFLLADCREEQYPCTRLYSVHKPCKQCLNEICFYSLRRVYVINKEICVRTVCAHEELLRALVYGPCSSHIAYRSHRGCSSVQCATHMACSSQYLVLI